MTETLTLPSHSVKDEMYAALLPQIEAVIAGVDDLIANLANVAAMLKQVSIFTGWASIAQRRRNC